MIGKSQILPALIVAAVVLSGPGAVADNITGAIVAGGGRSSSEGVTVVGAVQPTGTVSSRDSLLCFENGSLSIGHFSRARLRVSYDGRPIDTVTDGDATLRVWCDNAGQTLDGTLLFRPGGGRQYDTLQMIRQAGDTLACLLPENILTSRGLEYFFNIHNTIDYLTIGSQLQPNAMIVGGADRKFLCPAPLPNSSYRIVGLPLNLIGDSTPEMVLRDDLGRYDPSRWRLGRYDAVCDCVREIPEVPDFIPGRGFWLIAREGGAFGAQGYSVQPDFRWNDAWYYRLTVDSGWNQLANPFAFALNYRELLFVHNGSVLGHNPEIIDDIAYTFTGLDYATENILPPWAGFFLFVKKKNVEILFPYREAQVEIETEVPAKRPAISPSADKWQLTLTLRVGELRDAGNIFGVHPSASDDADICDHREPPPPPNGAFLAFRPPEAADGLYRCDLRAPSRDKYRFPVVLSDHKNRSLTVEGAYLLPGNRDLLLIIPERQPVLISADTTLMLPDSITEVCFQVVRSGNLHIQDSPLPQRFRLYQNYPNPFNASTTVRFALPRAEAVRLDVYNVLGQKVTTLLDARYDAGYHECHWDACDSRGRALSSGLYLLRLESDNRQRFIKTLLLK